MMPSRTKDYYKILQVDCSAEQEIIEAAYKRLARLYHPDFNRSSNSTVRMQNINEAYAILRDPVKRAYYDRERAFQPPESDSRVAEELRKRQEAEAAESKRRMEEQERLRAEWERTRPERERKAAREAADREAARDPAERQAARRKNAALLQTSLRVFGGGVVFFIPFLSAVTTGLSSLSPAAGVPESLLGVWFNVPVLNWLLWLILTLHFQGTEIGSSLLWSAGLWAVGGISILVSANFVPKE